MCPLPPCPSARRSRPMWSPSDRCRGVDSRSNSGCSSAMASSSRSPMVTVARASRRAAHARRDRHSSHRVDGMGGERRAGAADLSRASSSRRDSSPGPTARHLPAAARAAQARSPLALSTRMKLLSPRFLNPLAQVLQVFYAAARSSIPLLAAIAVAHWWLYFDFGLGGLMREGLPASCSARRSWLLVVLAIAFVSLIFHEFGHAAALRYAGQGRVAGRGNLPGLPRVLHRHNRQPSPRPLGQGADRPGRDLFPPDLRARPHRALRGLRSLLPARRRAAHPLSISGISRSMTTTSGASSAVAANAASPSAASPTTSRSPWSARKSRMPRRTIAWSSTSATRDRSADRSMVHRARAGPVHRRMACLRPRTRPR